MLAKLDYQNPFPGLRAFEAHEDIYFFGREKQVDELLRKLRTTRFLAVLGSSGSGKSSLIRSGLIPALYSGFMVGVSSFWSLCSFRPGNNPIGNLAKALAGDGVLYHLQPEEESTYQAIIESTLRRSSNGLLEVCQQSGARRNNLLILVDQFEELFRFSSYEKEAKEGKRDSVAFINLLLKAVEQKEFPVYIVFTMRSDFMGDCTAFRGLPEKMNEGQYLVPRMTREEKKEAITGPISVEGGAITPRLLNRLLNDVGENPDQLPILQHAMMRTWNVWKDSESPSPALDIIDYEEAGSMSYALSLHAEEAFNELDTPEKKKACEIMFKALTDREAGARGIRRPRSVAEIVKLTHVPVATQIEIIDVFRRQGRGFLMPADDVALYEDSIIDIAHESLMRGWDRLINWVEEEEQSAKIYLRLCEAADQYELGKAGLWRDPELQLALKWEEEANPDAAWAARYNNQFYKAKLFLEHSKNQYERERRHKEEMQRQRLRRARRVIAVVGLLGVGAFMMAIFALNQKSIAEKQKQNARDSAESARRYADSANTQRSIAVQQRAKADSSASEAEKDKIKALSSEADAKAQTIIAQNKTLEANKAKERAKNALSEKEEERKKAVNAKEETAQALGEAESSNKEAIKQANNAKTQTQIAEKFKKLADARVLANHSIALLNEKKINESRDTAMLAYELNNNNGGPTQNRDIYNALKQNWDNNHQHSVSLSPNPVRSVAVSPSGRLLYALSEAGIISQYTIGGNGLQKPTNAKSTAKARSMVLSPDGNSLIVLSADSNGAYISTSGLKEIGTFTFSGTGKTAAFLNAKECLILTNKGIGKYALSEGSHTVESKAYPKASALCIDKNGRIILAAASSIRVFNTWADLPQNPATAFAFMGTVTTISTDASGRYIAAGTREGTLYLKDLQRGETTYTSLQLHGSSINEIKFIATGTNLLVATAGADHTIRIADVSSVLLKKGDEDILTLTGHSSWVYSITYTPDGRNLYSAGEDQKIMRWETTMKGLYEALTPTK